MSGIPGSRLAGVGPTPPGERPEHAACRQRTPEEQMAVFGAQLRRTVLAVSEVFREVQRGVSR
ncbi:hypothetical protein [Plantactinospora sp. WMMB782]|uniref:hypothetical protein n=1 Tax=Plantactinospora sp. WMMB782 TaxID=3404121 RepID=UPI003B92DFCA